MTPAESVQRAVEMLEQQVADLGGIRNATARDPSFKNWRQATLTTMQRIWPGDQERSERFRRIPFSPADPRADHRAVREQYSRGCQEAGRVLTSFLDEIRERGVPELSDEPLPLAPEAEFEDGFPTLDLPTGDVPAPSDPSRLADNLLAGLGDEPPQGKDPSFADPARLPVTVPAAPAPSNGKKGVGMKARLRDLLGFAQLSAKSLAGFPRESNPVAPVVLQSDAVTPNTLGITPLGDDVGSVPAPVATIAAAAPAVPEPVTVPPVPAQRIETSGPVVEAASDVPADWPLLPRRTPSEAPTPWPAPRPAADIVTPVTTAAAPAPVEPAHAPELVAPVMPAAAAPTPAPSAPVVPAHAPEPVAPVMPAAAAPTPARSEPVVPAPLPAEPVAEESSSVIMSRPTTLRGTIDKVSIESIFSAEFRASTDENAAPAASASSPAAPPSSGPAPAAEPSPPASPPRPALTLVRPLLDDPEFNVDPTPASELPKPSADAPPSALVPKPSRAAGKRSPAAPKPAPAPPAAHQADDDDAFDSDEAIADATRGANVDPEEFARATDEFMRSSPVLGASPRRASRAQDTSDFGDPDAIAVASMAQDLTRMEVPKERHAEVRARLMDLARRLERGELEWSALRKAVWFAMEHPELARRLMPVLLPWIDRAA